VSISIKSAAPRSTLPPSEHAGSAYSSLQPSRAFRNEDGNLVLHGVTPRGIVPHEFTMTEKDGWVTFTETYEFEPFNPGEPEVLNLADVFALLDVMRAFEEQSPEQVTPEWKAFEEGLERFIQQAVQPR
jgi:hypothetical protein